MALDHFVSQVHLRNFYSPALEGMKMHAVRKSDFKQFPCGSEDVCRVENGSTNEYLLHDRILEDFLKFIEPNYNASIQNLRDNKIDADSILVIAGFISFVMSCSPAAMRIHCAPLQHMVEAEAALLDKMGVLSPAPATLGGKTLSELLRQGMVKVNVDEKYPQAIGISSIVERTIRFGNFDWDVLINEEADSSFFSSDFPVAIERGSDKRVLNRLTPLAPDIAVRIRPSLDPDREKGGVDFPYFKSTRRRLNRDEIRAANQLIVRCAEELVFFRDDHKWVTRFLKKNVGFRIEPKTNRIPNGKGGFLLHTTMGIEQYKHKK